MFRHFIQPRTMAAYTCLNVYVLKRDLRWRIASRTTLMSILMIIAALSKLTFPQQVSRQLLITGKAYVDGVGIFYREAGPRTRRRAAAARLSDLVAHVPQPDPGAGGPLSRDRAGLPGLTGRATCRTAPRSLTRSIALPNSSMGCSISSASRGTRCTSWTTARR